MVSRSTSSAPSCGALIFTYGRASRPGLIARASSDGQPTEVPCAGRVGSPNPLDELIDTMREICRNMDVQYRETAGGGLAATPTGRKLAKERLVRLTRPGM